MLNSLQDRIAAGILGRFPRLSPAALPFRPAAGAARGDVSLSTFQAAKELGKPAVEVTRECSQLPLPPGISAAASEGPYVNYRSPRLYRGIVRRHDRCELRLLEQRRAQPLFEHTSINPNASPHLGRARNALLGDNLVRLLRFQGHAAWRCWASRLRSAGSARLSRRAA
jgi:arginyl-tRNA synthetase